MEWHAIKALIAEQNITLDFDVPTDIEMQKLAADCEHVDDWDILDEDDPYTPA